MDARSILELTGFVLLPGVVSDEHCRDILARLAARGPGAGTHSLLAEDWCAGLAMALRDTLDLGAALTGSLAVQCTYFEKSPGGSWLEPLRPGPGIPVRERVADARLDGWLEKDGMLFVRPPAEILDELTVVRLHLDDATSDNGALRVIPGSHRLGPLNPEQLHDYREVHGEVVCATPRGGVLAMKPLLLHASSRATVPRPRRVLHYLYGPRELPYGLAWARAV